MGGRGGSGGGWIAKGLTPASLEYHYSKHGSQFTKNGKQISKEAFEKRAIDLLNSEIGGNIDGFTTDYGSVYRYDRSNNTFAVGRPDGTIRTFYKPDNGLNYWKGEEKKHGK